MSRYIVTGYNDKITVTIIQSGPNTPDKWKLNKKITEMFIIK